MQEYLIQRYLGNKASVTGHIVSLVRSIAKPGDMIFDAFSGSLAVSASLRAAGFRLACNDINYFSWVFARAYFSTAAMPWPNGEKKKSKGKVETWEAVITELVSPYTPNVPVKARRTDFFDHYCEKGSKSAFKSGRGSTGRRRFFSPENAKLIDRALSRLRFWHQRNQIDELTRCVLVASLLSAVEKVSNTQGTYHDFPRSFIDRRALNPLQLRPPRPELFGGLESTCIGRARDTLEFAPEVPRHSVLYLDPPYNFRQYTSYYFMLNLIALYPELEDPQEFFSQIEFVRGQNMSTDFKSSFCSKDAFIPSLEKLIRAANTDYVVLSYFNGRNHWGEFKTDARETRGRELLSEFFATDLFVPKSLRCHPVTRLNYQSYGGYEAKHVQELLFVAQKSMLRSRSAVSGASSGLGSNRTRRAAAVVA